MQLLSLSVGLSALIGQNCDVRFFNKRWRPWGICRIVSTAYVKSFFHVHSEVGTLTSSQYKSVDDDNLKRYVKFQDK